MATGAVVGVLLVMNHPSALLGLRAVLEVSSEIVVVAAVRTMAAAVAEARRGQPDVLIVDERLSSCSGAEVCRAVRDVCPLVRALLLVSSASDTALRAVFEAGASGYLLRDLNTAAMRQAVLDTGRDPSPSRADHASLRECRAHEPRAAHESCPLN